MGERGGARGALAPYTTFLAGVKSTEAALLPVADGGACAYSPDSRGDGRSF
jgi:hypothetical protein